MTVSKQYILTVMINLLALSVALLVSNYLSVYLIGTQEFGLTFIIALLVFGGLAYTFTQGKDFERVFISIVVAGTIFAFVPLFFGGGLLMEMFGQSAVTVWLFVWLFSLEGLVTGAAVSGLISAIFDLDKLQLPPWYEEQS